jgi:uncharacterized membrane protein YkoI
MGWYMGKTIERSVKMQFRILGYVFVTVLVAGMSGCDAVSKWRGEKETLAQQVPLSAVSEPARIAIEKSTAGGQIKKIEKEEVDGKVVYDVEATVGGKDMEYDVASDGTVLTVEQSVSYDSLPAEVRTAAEKYFGSAAGLKAAKELENGKTFYEVEGTKKNKAVALKLTDVGRIVEEEE